MDIINSKGENNMQLFDERRIKSEKNTKGIKTLTKLIDLGYEQECYDCLKGLYNIILNTEHIIGNDGLLYSKFINKEENIDNFICKFKDLLIKTTASGITKEILIEMIFCNYRLTVSTTELNSRSGVIGQNNNNGISMYYNLNTIPESLKSEILNQIESI
ncbi:hypothetical protein HMPREF3070_07800 [Clostridium sp. HMSC19A10]|nr:hypothetical protein HMPREF3070_07800 [Clostridium sp. HMSC19A10]